MTEIRAAFPIELRAADDAERVVEGIVVPWNETSYLTADPNGERFLPGSLTRSVKERGARLKLFAAHDHSHAVGKAVKLDPRHPDGLWASWQMFDTPQGRDTYHEIREGASDAFSIGFQPIKARRGADGAREIVEASIAEASVLPLGAYDGARVLSVRSPHEAEAVRADDVQAWLDAHPVPSLRLTAPVVLRRH